MKKAIICLLAIFMASMSAFAQSPKRELRTVWFTTYMRIDWPSQVGTSASVQSKQKAEFIQYLDNFDRRNFNGICIQVRSLCDAMYESSYEPWSVAISGTRGTNPGWDPLKFAVEECHKRGLECWAWVNPFRQRKQANNFTTSFDKEWANKGMLLTYDNYTVMDPANSQARQHILNVIKEIYTKYAVDGLLFDDYFYPNNIPENSSAQDYNTWKNSGTKLSFGDWRRENINSFMRELYAQIANDRPDLRFGLSPAGVAYLGAYQYGYSKPNVGTTDWQYGTIYSDPAAWLHDGSVDFISPQLYWTTNHSSAPYGPLCDWWSKIAHDFNRHFYSSQGSYRINNDLTTNDVKGWSEMATQVELNRQYNHDNAPGSIWYSAKYFDGPTCTGMGQYLADNTYQTKSLTPILSWKQNPGYAAPANLKVSNSKLTWSAVAGKRSNSIIRYTVYAIPQSVSPEGAMAKDGDGIDIKYLMDVSYSTTFSLPSDRTSGYWYAVCTYDGYGYESKAATCNYNGQGENPNEGPGNYEAGYTVKVDPANYLNSDKITLTNLWMRSVLPEFNNFSMEGDGALNRGIAISGNYIYMAGRSAGSASADIYLAKYDILTGERVGVLNLSDEGKCAYFPCNDVLRDNAGNICISNLTLDASGTNPIVLHKVDLTTGALTEVARLNVSGAKFRVDHVGLYGDVTSGKFYVFAAQASGNNIARWTVQNGKATEFIMKAASALCPSNASSFGIAPKVYAISADKVWVDGQGSIPALYDATTGKLLSSYGDKTQIKPISASPNGICCFTLNKADYSVVAHSDMNEGWQFMVTRADVAGSAISAHNPLWVVPEGGLGKENPGNYATPCDVKVCDDGSALIAVYSCGNGLAVYRLTDGNVTGANIIIADKTPAWKISGRTVRFGLNTPVKVYTMSGSLVAVYNGEQFTLPTAGSYIVSTPELTRVVTVR